MSLEDDSQEPRFLSSMLHSFESFPSPARLGEATGPANADADKRVFARRTYVAAAAVNKR